MVPLAASIAVGQCESGRRDYPCSGDGYHFLPETYPKDGLQRMTNEGCAGVRDAPRGDQAVSGDPCAAGAGRCGNPQIGRAECGERVCQYVLISGVSVSLKKKKTKKQ